MLPIYLHLPCFIAPTSSNKGEGKEVTKAISIVSDTQIQIKSVSDSELLLLAIPSLQCFTFIVRESESLKSENNLRDPPGQVLYVPLPPEQRPGEVKWPIFVILFYGNSQWFIFVFKTKIKILYLECRDFNALASDWVPCPEHPTTTRSTSVWLRVRRLSPVSSDIVSSSKISLASLFLSTPQTEQ